MKRLVPVVILSIAVGVALDFNLDKPKKTEQPETVQNTSNGKKTTNYRVIEGVVKNGETLYGLFKRYSLDLRDLVKMKEASASVHRLRNVSESRPFKLTVDEQNRVHAFEYNIDDTCLLSIVRGDNEFIAKKCHIAYERTVNHVAGTIKGNLVSSIGTGRENLLLALNLLTSWRGISISPAISERAIHTRLW